MGKKKDKELKPEVVEVLTDMEAARKRLVELRKKCPHSHKIQKDPYDQSFDANWESYSCPECGRAWKERTTHEVKELNTN